MNFLDLNGLSYLKTKLESIIANHHDSTKQDTLTAGTGISISSNNTITNDLVFWVTRGVTTFAQITNAINAGKIPMMNYLDSRWEYFGLSGNSHIFAQQYGTASNYVRCNSDNSWNNGFLDTQNAANRVNTISASSTNAEYPSAKCVYDLITAVEAQVDSKIQAAIGDAMEDSY